MEEDQEDNTNLYDQDEGHLFSDRYEDDDIIEEHLDNDDDLLKPESSIIEEIKMQSPVTQQKKRPELEFTEEYENQQFLSDDEVFQDLASEQQSQVQEEISQTSIQVYSHNLSARKKRIIIQGDSSARRRPPQLEEGGRAPQILPNKGSESRASKKSQQQELANGGFNMKPQNTHQQSKTTKINDEEILQKKKVHQKSARLIPLPRTNQSSTLQQSSIDMSGDSLFDSIFDNLTQNLLNYPMNSREQPASPPIIDQKQLMFEYTQRLRQEALNKYASHEQQIRQNYSDTITEFKLKKKLVESKKQSLESLIEIQRAKSQVMIESFDSSFSNKFRDFNNPLFDQGWRLVQNWIFSLIADTEKCVRFSRMKAIKHIKHVQKEKLKYQENRIHQVFNSTIQTIKQIPFVKLTQQKNMMQPLNSEVIDLLSKILNTSAQNLEHIGTIRNKPYLKLHKNSELTYRISQDQLQFPSISTLLQYCDSLSQNNHEFLHLTASKIQLKQFSMTPQQLDQTITNDVILPFQEPSLSSKRELRVFVCAKQAQKDLIKKNIDEIFPFKDLMHTMGSSDVLRINECTIKRLKNTNQLKIQIEGKTEFSILNECRLRDLINCQVFESYFQTQENLESVLKQSQKIDDFYIIEENSFFCQDPFKIVNSQRKLQHFRRLSAFEVTLLIFKSFGHLLVTSQSFQFVELKLQQDALKKLANPESDNSIADSKSETDKNYRYIVVDCHYQNDKLVKQYLVKCSNLQQVNQIKEDSNYCMYPNCLQCAPPIIKFDGSTQRSIQVQVASTTGVAQKKVRPESAGNRNTGYNNGMITNRVNKRLTRLPMVLEMDISDSPLLKILGKKFKIGSGINPQQLILNKDKSAKNIIANTGQQATLMVGNTIEQQQQQIGNPRQNNYQVKRESFITSQTTTNLNFCTYHQELERFITQKLNISLQPIYLRPNSFQKAIKSNFQNWKEEIKGSLAFDLFLSKASLNDTLNKLFSVCLSNHSLQKISVTPDASSYTDYVFTQQPQVINILENYYNWIANAQKKTRGIFCKNQVFQEARKHIMTQIQAFNMNLYQAKDNEQFLGAELKRWLTLQNLIAQLSSQNNPVFLQLVDIVRSRDVIFKFQQFQVLADRLNSGLMSEVNTAIQQHINMQVPTPILPKIQQEGGSGSHYQSGQTTIKQSNQTHTQGFFPRQESFNSNKVVDKLTQIYGAGSSQIGGIASMSGTNFNPQKKVQPQLVDNLRYTGNYDLCKLFLVSYRIEQSAPGSNLKQQPLVNHLLPIQRKFSAGNKRTDNQLPLSNNINVIDQSLSTKQDSIVPPPLQNNLIVANNNSGSGLQYFTYSQCSHQGISAQQAKIQSFQDQQVMESPHSSKTYKGKNDIMLPIPTSNSGVGILQKQRAISAHKYNQQNSLTSGNSIQNNNEYYNGTSSGLIQGVANILGQRPGTNTSLYDANGQLLQQRQTSSQMRNQKMFAQNEIHAQAMAVAQTFQQPPPKFPIMAPQQMFINQAPFIPQHSLIPIQPKVMPPRHTGLPSNLLNTNNSSKLKQVERQQIIVNAYSQPQNVPIKTQIGFHPQTGAQFLIQTKPTAQINISGSNTASQLQPRVASAHQEKDKKKLIMIERQTKKSKKKGSHSNASRVSGNQQFTDHHTAGEDGQQ